MPDETSDFTYKGFGVSRRGPDRRQVTAPDGGQVAMFNRDHDAKALIDNLTSDIEAPTLEAIDPNSAIVGGVDRQVTITGANFTPDTVLIWNGSPDTCEVVDDTTITTLVKVSQSTVAVDVPVAVRNDWGTSNELTFSFTEPVQK